MVRHTRRHRARALLLVPLLSLAVALGGVSGCTEEAPVAPASPFTGRWVLIAVNGAALPRNFETLLDGSQRGVVGGEITVRSRGRLDDTKRIALTRPNGVRAEDFVDTLTAPFSATETQLLIRRYALLAEDDWVDTGTVLGGNLELRVRYLEPRYRLVQRVVLSYQRVQ
ncbi:MAG: hypothetical protein KA154_01510 [Gemmatimonadaceae bacterium]|jgi:hypothetical protein|nr:hypothetical protein [Gemmatimonadaceae bacterium]MCC6429966.1 hypothetical protein [Gemmatimonadaceae bacterium]